MKHRIWHLLLTFALIFGLVPGQVLGAENITIDAIKENVQDVTISGEASFPEILIKISKPDGTLIYIDQTTSNTAGQYSLTFTLPEATQDGEYEVQVGHGKTVKNDTFAVNTSSENPGGPGGGGGGSTIQKSVNLTVTNASGQTLFNQKVKIKNSDTPYSILTEAMPGQVEAKGSGQSLYVNGISGLKEFDHGPSSGWMFAVNGTYLSQSAGAISLKNGDTVNWSYTKDGGKDLGETPTPGTSTSPGAGGSADQTQIDKQDIDTQLKKVTHYILNKQQLSDWEAFAMGQTTEGIPASYLTQIEKLLKENQANFRKVTDLERMVLALTAADKNPTSFAGYNLLEKIYNHENLTMQGSNGVIFALIALDSNGYDVASNAIWNRDKLTQWLLEAQNEDGGWPLAKKDVSSIDITAMALSALAPYQDELKVEQAIEKAVTWLSTEQLNNNGYLEVGVETSESIAQVIIGLSAVNIDPLDTQFIKGSGNLLSALLAYQQTDGGFAHIAGTTSDPMATEQAFAALIAYDRFTKGQGSIYHFSGKPPKVEPEVPDISDEDHLYVDDAQIADWAKEAVYRARDLEIMTGISTDQPIFSPKEHLTRAQFVTLLHDVLNETPETPGQSIFTDIVSGSWYDGYVSSAYAKDWVRGISSTAFGPTMAITRQDLAVILDHALELDAATTNVKIKDMNQAKDYAKSSINAVYDAQLMVGYNGFFDPIDLVTREMAAVIATDIVDHMNSNQ